jgi:hypothetical protein
MNCTMDYRDAIAQLGIGVPAGLWQLVIFEWGNKNLGNYGTRRLGRNSMFPDRNFNTPPIFLRGRRSCFDCSFPYQGTSFFPFFGGWFTWIVTLGRVCDEVHLHPALFAIMLNELSSPVYRPRLPSRRVYRSHGRRNEVASQEI